jgi:hypothetical protein
MAIGAGKLQPATRYREFTRQLDAIPANERLRHVLDERLCDRRHKPQAGGTQASTRAAGDQG